VKIIFLREVPWGRIFILEIPALPPNGFLVGIYKFYERWATETFRRKKSEKWAV
jgi:hypothetical protein